ncbi:hypothetical protein ACGVWS_03800 [Enterobacteriaceae bacterium LUAb1]
MLVLPVFALRNKNHLEKNVLAAIGPYLKMIFASAVHYTRQDQREYK